MMGIRSISRFTVAGLALLGLSACSTFEPEYTACPDVKAVEGAENIVMASPATGHAITVRFDDVLAKCVARGDGYDLKLDFAMVMRRDLSLYGKVEEVPFDLTLAFIDADDQVVARSEHRFTGYIPGMIAASRPLFSLKDEIPSGTRVVMGLGRKIEAE